MFVAGAIVLGMLILQRVTKSLGKLAKFTKVLGLGKFDQSVEINTSDEVGALAHDLNTLSSSMRVNISNAKEVLRDELYYDYELKIGENVSEDLFPEESISFKGMDHIYHFAPATEYNGLWWNYSQIENRIFFCIAEIDSNSTQAAIICSALKSAGAVAQSIPKIPVSQVMPFLNNAVFQITKGKSGVKVFLLAYDTENSTITFSNAGHHSPLLFNYQNPTQLASLMETSGTLIGLKPNSLYKDQTLDVKAGDTILFFNLGLFKVISETKKALGQKSFLTLLIGAIKKSKDIFDVSEQVTRSLNQFKGKEIQVEDSFYGLIKIAGPKTQAPPPPLEKPEEEEAEESDSESEPA